MNFAVVTHSNIYLFSIIYFIVIPTQVFLFAKARIVAAAKTLFAIIKAIEGKD
jgi:hypothetical protein